MALFTKIPVSTFAGLAGTLIIRRKRKLHFPKHLFHFKSKAMTTYIRKYYLHRKVKEAGFGLQLEELKQNY